MVGRGYVPANPGTKGKIGGDVTPPYHFVAPDDAGRDLAAARESEFGEEACRGTASEGMPMHF